jgi:hypothetical protein
MERTNSGKIGFCLLMAFIVFQFGAAGSDTCRLCKTKKELDLTKSFREIYPFTQTQNMGYMSSYRKDDPILFEANPRVRFSFYNDFVSHLMNVSNSTGEAKKQRIGKAFYAGFNSQLRMYKNNSLPVQMPSYQIVIGGQFGKLTNGSSPNFKRLYVVSFESGHYSNGQAGCAFAHGIEDESPACDSVYRTITNSTNLSEKLNRIDGNFSTNLTRIGLGYRSFKKDDKSCHMVRSWNFQLEYTLYHDRFWGVFPFGGYTDRDIDIYGAHRLSAKVEWSTVFCNRYTLTASNEFEYIFGCHPWVNPARNETRISVFPFPVVPMVGFFVGMYTGHDNYNFRFVDKGTVVNAGICWSAFQPLKLTNCD